MLLTKFEVTFFCITYLHEFQIGVKNLHVKQIQLFHFQKINESVDK